VTNPLTTEVLEVVVDDATAIVTLNRPQARNALNAALRRDLWAAFTALDADNSVSAIILTGADPAFCAGLDLKELGSTGGGISDRGDLEISGGARPIPRMTKPVIGAMNGVAVTGGFELALCCDLLIGSEHARFADTHARIGVQPGWGLTVELRRAVGIRRAKELSATGNYLDADHALAWGLINHLVPHEGLLDHARKLAADIASNDRAGVARIFATYDQGAGLTDDEALRLESRVAADWLATVSGADVEARRQAVTERGRSQQP